MDVNHTVSFGPEARKSSPACFIYSYCGFSVSNQDESRTVSFSVDRYHAHGVNSFKNSTHKHQNYLSSLLQQALYVTFETHHSTSISKSQRENKKSLRTSLHYKLGFYNNGDGIALNSINNAFQGLLHIHLKEENKIKVIILQMLYKKCLFLSNVNRQIRYIYVHTSLHLNRIYYYAKNAIKITQHTWTGNHPYPK